MYYKGREEVGGKETWYCFYYTVWFYQAFRNQKIYVKNKGKQQKKTFKAVTLFEVKCCLFVVVCCIYLTMAWAHIQFNSIAKLL